MSKNKKKTAREKRILVGAFLTAVVIAAGSTFAWFTSTDTVTNRLSANADYDVKIVESFAPPANWMPGEKVDKDVYAVNTGNIEAFAKATVSGVMSITREVPVPIPEGLNGNTIQNDPTEAVPESWKMWNDEWQSVNGAPANPALLSSVHGITGNGVVIPKNATLYRVVDNTYSWYTIDEGNNYHSVSMDGTISTDVVSVSGTLSNVSSLSTIDVQTIAPGATHYATVENNIQFFKYNGGSEASAGGWNFDNIYDCVTLTPDEVAVIEAGAYLAYMPDTDLVNKDKLGNKVIAYKEPTKTGATTTTYWDKHGTDDQTQWTPVPQQVYDDAVAEDDAQSSYVKIDGSDGEFEGDPSNSKKTDFTPHGDGLYVFRRSIVVAPGDNLPNSNTMAGTETFEYEGYYYLGGRYYKIMNLNVDADNQFDVAADGITSDGQLDGATACLVREEKKYGLKPSRFTYDAANNRIIASYDTNTENTLLKSNYKELAEQLDAAEHAFAEAELLLQRALEDSDIVSDSVKDKTKEVDAAQLAYNQALAAYEKAKAEFEEAREAYLSGKNAFTTAQGEAVTAFTNLVGAGGVVSDNAKVTGKSDAANPAKTGDTWTAGTSTLKNGDATLIADANSPAAKYGAALYDFWDWVQRNVANGGTPTTGDHIAFVFLKELSKASTTAIGNGNYYTLPSTGNFAGWDSADFDASKITPEELEEQLELAFESVTYQYAASIIAPNVFGGEDATNPDVHEFHQKFAALRMAEEEYNNKLTAYNTAIGNLNKAIGDLGEKDNFKKIVDTIPEGETGTLTTVDSTLLNGLKPWESQKAENVRTTYNTLTGKTLEATNPTDESTALNYAGENKLPYTEEEIQAWEAAEAGQHDGREKELWDAWQKLKNAQAALAAVEDKTYIDLAEQTAGGQDNTNYGLPWQGPNYVKLTDGGELPADYNDATKYKIGEGDNAGYVVDMSGNKVVDPTVPSSVDNDKVAQHLKDAWANYYNKRNAVDELGRKLKAAQNAFYNDGALNVYIYLKNVTLTGDEAKKWQLLPTDLADDKATFYYTSILAAGEVSEQLIDYVELDERTTKEMYKYFDFDLNVTLDSAQVKFNEDGSRSAEPANIAFDWVETNKKSHDVTGMIKNPTVAPTDGTSNGTVVTWSEKTAEAPAGAEQYTPVSMIPQNANPSANGWYEFINGAYVETDDTIVDWNKTYYTDGSNSGQQGISATFRDTPVTLMPSTASGKFGATDGEDITFAYEFAMNGQTYYVENTTGSPILVYVLSTSGNYYVFPTGDNVLQLA